MEEEDGDLKIQLTEQLSTDTSGIATCLGLQSEAKVGLQSILARIEAKLSEHTLMNIEMPPPAASLIGDAEEDES